MKRSFIPIGMAVLGLGIGLGSGLLLRPEAASSADRSATDAEQSSPEALTTTTDTGVEYVRLSNQFVVPVVDEGKVRSMVVLSLSLELAEGAADTVYSREPKLRDVFLQVLFDHANLGGFNGSFTEGSNLVLLRSRLKDAAVMVLGPDVTNVLITDIARQDS